MQHPVTPCCTRWYTPHGRAMQASSRFASVAIERHHDPLRADFASLPATSPSQINTHALESILAHATRWAAVVCDRNITPLARQAPTWPPRRAGAGLARTSCVLPGQQHRSGATGSTLLLASAALRESAPASRNTPVQRQPLHAGTHELPGPSLTPSLTLRRG